MACWDMYNTCLSNLTSCRNEKQKNDEIAASFGKPMPWIGIYVAAASLICCLSMAADAIRGFCSKKLWFPCKFFTLNAASLTLLTVAMKLPLDLTDDMPGKIDQLAKRCSIHFMCTAMSNFTISVGSMNSKEMVMNIIALGILVVTIAVNSWIQFKTGVIYPHLLFSDVSLMMLYMFALFLLISFSALIVSSIKEHLELKCAEIHNMMRNEELQATSKENLRDNLSKYWMTIETGDPQFVMARLATSCTSGAMCSLAASCLLGVEIYVYNTYDVVLCHDNHSVYKWTTSFILLVQSAGVFIGSIAPMFRWFIATGLKGSKREGKWYMKELSIENYWIESMIVCKERSLELHIQSQKCRKFVQLTKNMTLNIFIGVVILIVILSKAIQLLSILLLVPLFLCWNFSKRLKRKLVSRLWHDHQSRSEEELGGGLDLSRYVLLLEGEEELPQSMLNNIKQEFDRLIMEGEKQKPKYLQELLHKCRGAFEGVRKFDSDQVPFLYSEAFPHCWSLPVATLTSIALSLHGVDATTRDWLIHSVTEGLLLAKLVETNLETARDSKNIRNATDVVWAGVECYGSWLDKDLQKMALQAKTFQETIQGLANTAEEIVLQFAKIKNRGIIVNPANWPVKVIAANAMYRICRTLLLIDEDQSGMSFFEELVVIIADILGACLTNLPRVMTMKCYIGSIEERGKSVHHAASLLGKTEEILLLLQQHQIPVSLDPEKLANIASWRQALMKEENPSLLANASQNMVPPSHYEKDARIKGNNMDHISIYI